MKALRILTGATLTAGVLLTGLIAPGAASATHVIGTGGFCGGPGEKPCDGVCIAIHQMHPICILGSGG